MLLSFKLSMPNNNSWNGKWSGEGRPYVKVRSIRARGVAGPILQKGYYHYSFGDGWSAGIHVEEVTASQARKLRKESVGFCGYDWMIDSIFTHGEIRA